MNGRDIWSALSRKRVELSSVPFRCHHVYVRLWNFEIKISNRLNWWLELHGLLPITQFGFRKQRLCSDNLALLYGEILKAWQQGTAVATVF